MGDIIREVARWGRMNWDRMGEVPNHGYCCGKNDLPDHNATQGMMSFRMPPNSKSCQVCKDKTCWVRHKEIEDHLTFPVKSGWK